MKSLFSLPSCAASAFSLPGAGIVREAPEKYWNFSALEQAPACREANFPDSEVPGLRAILFDGVPVDNAPAPVFAYVGYPEGPMPTGGFPGVVLVHGGGGTAFPQYVRLWNSYGYAVIAPDWYNQRPVADTHPSETNVRRIPLAGGRRQLHEVNAANMVLAHSLLRSLPRVNQDKTAFVGLSWGSWYGAMVAAIDPRFRCAIEIYCGDCDPARKGFQSMVDGRFLHAAKVPMFYISGTNDQNVTPESLQRGFDECAKLWNHAMVIDLPHSHTGFTFQVCRRVADHFLKDGPALPKLGRARLDGDTIAAKLLDPGKGVKHAMLCWTADRNEPAAYKRQWRTQSAELTGDTVHAKLPENAWQCFLSVYDESSTAGHSCGSSNLVTRPPRSTAPNRCPNRQTKP